MRKADCYFKTGQSTGDGSLCYTSNQRIEVNQACNHSKKNHAHRTVPCAFPCAFLRDAMNIYCSTKRKIYIEAAYEDYLTLWNKIIAKASENNPRVTVSSKMINRLGKSQ